MTRRLLEVRTQERRHTCTSKVVRGWLGNTLLASRDRDRFVTMHAAAVVLTTSDKGILLAGDSYAGKSSIAAALHRQGAFWAADDMGRIEHAHEGWLLHPSWPIQRLRAASGEMSAIAVRTRQLTGAVRLRAVYRLISERSASRVEFRPLDGTEHADVVLTAHLKDERRVLRHDDWRDTVTIAHAWGWDGPAGWSVARPAKWSAEQTAAAILEHASSDTETPRRRRVRSAA